MDREDIPGQTMAQWSRHIKEPDFTSTEDALAEAPLWIELYLPPLSLLTENILKITEGPLGECIMSANHTKEKNAQHVCTRCVNLDLTREIGSTVHGLPVGTGD